MMLAVDYYRMVATKHENARCYMRVGGYLHYEAMREVMWCVQRLDLYGQALEVEYFVRQEEAERYAKLWIDLFPSRSALITHRFSRDLDMQLGIVGRLRGETRNG